MFSDSKVAQLETKLDIYEELSREMLAKLETAVDKISEGNTRIAQILAKHDERIEQSIKSDELIIKMIDEIKDNEEIRTIELFMVGLIRYKKILNHSLNLDGRLVVFWLLGHF